MNAIKTKHNLDFEACPWPRNPSIMLFRVGSCHGQYFFDENSLYILSVVNDTPGNGHLDDVFEWFEYSARTNDKLLTILEFMNLQFKRHCIDKRGFKEIPGTDSLVKACKGEGRVRK